MENKMQNETSACVQEQESFGDTMVDAVIGGVAAGTCLAVLYGTARLGITAIEWGFQKLGPKDKTEEAAPAKAEKKGQK